MENQAIVLLAVIAVAVIVYKLNEPLGKKDELEIKKRQQKELERVAKKSANIKANLYKIEAEIEVTVKNNSRANV